MVAPQPFNTLNQIGLRKLRFVPTQLGMRAFMIKFPAALGPLLGITLKTAIRNNDLKPTDTKAITLHGYINDALISSMDELDDLILQMTHVNGEYGVANLLFLKERFDPSSTASSIGTLVDIIKKPLDTQNIINDMQAKIAANAGLPGNLVLPPDILTVTLLLGLPQSLATLKDIVIERDALPTVQQLIAKVKSNMEFNKTQSTNGDMAFAFVKSTRGKFCYNCDANGHITKECTKAKTNCEICGTAAGHSKKHCFVTNDKVLPEFMSAEKKAEITAKRVAYKANPASATSAMLVTNLDDFDEDFWATFELPYHL